MISAATSETSQYASTDLEGFSDVALPRVLLVDDEPYLLEAMVRRLRNHFDFTLATGGSEGIEALKSAGPFEVIVSDMQMPGLDGVAVLTYAEVNSPATVRVLLTGNADLESAAAAVNYGNVYRILSKPMQSELMRKVLVDCVSRHRSEVVRQEQLQSTVYGIVSGMLDTLVMASPSTFARAARVKGLVSDIAKYVKPANQWDLMSAAIVSQMGLVTLPSALLQKLDSGQPLDSDEAPLLNGLPHFAEQMVQAMPAFDVIRSIIHEQRMWASPDAPIECKVIQIATDWEAFDSQGMEVDAIATRLEERAVDYGDIVTEAMMLVADERRRLTQTSVLVSDLKLGMVVAEDVFADTGTLLIGRGARMTAAQLQRLHNLVEPTRLMLISAG